MTMWAVLYYLVLLDVFLTMRPGRVELNPLVNGLGLGSSIVLLSVCLAILLVLVVLFSEVKVVTWILFLVLAACIYGRFLMVLLSL
jgi:hypothetical protein